MTAEVRYTAWVAPVCPAGTAVGTFTLTDVPIETAWVWTVNVRIPPGHAGLTGIAVVDSNQFVLPYGGITPAWLIGDDDDLEFPYGDQVGANVVLATYNTDDTYDHGWQVRLVYTPMTLKGTGDEVIITPDVADWLAEVEAGLS